MSQNNLLPNEIDLSAYWMPFTPNRQFKANPRLLVGAHAAFLWQRIAQGDFTLRSLVAELSSRGLKVDYRTVWAFVHRQGLSFKKNRVAKRARPA